MLDVCVGLGVVGLVVKGSVPLRSVLLWDGAGLGGQLLAGHLTDSGLTSGSPLVCGTRIA